MEVRVEVVEKALDLLQESVQKDHSEFREWLAEARADQKEAKAERKRLVGQINELLRQDATSSWREIG